MAYQRALTNYVTTAANAQDQKFKVAYNDSYRLIHIKGYYAGTIAAGFAVGLQVNGFEVCRVDTTRFANGDAPVHVDTDVPANANLQIVTNDQAGTARTTVPVTILYEVDSDK